VPGPSPDFRPQSRPSPLAYTVPRPCSNVVVMAHDCRAGMVVATLAEMFASTCGAAVARRHSLLIGVFSSEGRQANSPRRLLPETLTAKVVLTARFFVCSSQKTVAWSEKPKTELERKPEGFCALRPPVVSRLSWARTPVHISQLPGGLFINCFV